MPLIDSIREQEEKKKKNTSTPAQPRKVVSRTPNATRTTGIWKTQHAPQTVSAGRSARYGVSGERMNYELVPSASWNAPQACAYGRISGDQKVFEILDTQTNVRGSQFWNPYRGGQSVIPDECRQALAQAGYDHVDQQVIDELMAIYGNDVRLSKAMGVSAPTKKSSQAEILGYWATQLQDNQIENNKLNEEFSEVRKALNDYYDQYVQINGHEPSYEEFAGIFDISKYSKLKSIDDALRYGGKQQIMPTGTFFSPDILPGLYYAKRNGMDINADRDYFEDAVQYYMSPVAKSPSVQQFDWSGDDLSAVSQNDYEKHLGQLKAQGNWNEAAAYEWAYWAAQPHADGISTEPSILDAAIGHYHDEAWFQEAHKRVNLNAYLLNDGTMNNPGKNASYEAKAAWELYNAEKTREHTMDVENAYAEKVKQVQFVFDRMAADGSYSSDDYEKFRDDVLYYLDLEHDDLLKDYLKNGYNPDKYCRELPISNDNFDAIIKRVWDGKDVSPNADYTVAIDDEYESPYGTDKPVEKPVMYDAMQAQGAAQRVADRNNAEREVSQAVMELADSGAHVSKSDLNVLTEEFEMGASMLGSDGSNLSAIMAAMWSRVREKALNEKLGEGYTIEQAAAADPVLGLLDTQNMPEKISPIDTLMILGSYMYSKVHDGAICVADGIVNNVLPGAEHLHNIMLDKYPEIVSGESNVEFNPVTYKGTYEELTDGGMSEEDAADIAYFAATDLNTAVNTIGSAYEGDKDLEAATGKLMADMASEEGAKDSYELLKAISDSVKETFSDVDKNVQPLLDKLNSVLLLGASNAASEGFKAQTNEVIQDFATGDITPEDVARGVAASQGDMWDVEFGADDWSDEDWARLKENGTAPADATVTLRNGIIIPESQYRDVVQNELPNYDPFINPGELSDEAKAIIGYDSVMEMAQKYYPDDADIQAMMVSDAIKAVTETDSVYGTNPEMYNATPLIDNLNMIVGTTTEHEESLNEVSGRTSRVGLWAAKEASGLAEALIAYTYLSDERSDTYDFIHLMRANSKFLSAEEADALYSAFDSNKISFEQAQNLINERVLAVGSDVANASQNKAMLAKGVQGLRKGTAELSKAVENAPTEQILGKDEMVQRLVGGEDVNDLMEQYPSAFKDVDLEQLNNLMATSYFHSEEELADEIRQLIPENEEAYRPAYTAEQVDTMNAFIDLYEDAGVQGFALASLDNGTIKDMFGIDIASTGFDSAYDMLNSLNPGWAAAYGTNPGYKYGVFEATVRGAAEGMTALVKMPANIGNAVHFLGSWISGQEYQTPTSGAYANIKASEERRSAEKQNMATGLETFVEQGVSEVTRNLATSAIGGALSQKFLSWASSVVPGLHLANVSGEVASLTDTVANIGNLDTQSKNILSIAKGIGRLPFGASVFTNSLSEHLESGDSPLKSFSLAFSETLIEMVTEDLPLEKFHILGSHAHSYVNNASTQMRAWVTRTANAMISEIGEEEASEFLNRIVDTAVGTIEGEDYVSSLKRAFEGYPEAVKDTAVATAFSTFLFGVLDLNGITANYVQDRIASNQQVDSETLMRYMEVDMAANEEETSAEPIEAPSEPVQQEMTEEPQEPVQEQEQAAEPASEYNPATDVSTWGKRTDSAQKQMTQAVKAYAKDPSEENATKVEQVSKALTKAQEEDRAEAEQQKAEQAAQEAQEAAPEPAQEQLEEPVEAVQPRLSEGAQKVKNLMDASEAARDEAIVNKGAEMEAEKAVANDPGLRSQQEALDKAQVKIQEGEQKIASLQQAAQKVVGQMRQAFQAVVNEGLDPNGPQSINVRAAKAQEKAGIDGDIAVETEKNEALKREAEEAKAAMDAEQERIEKETMDKAVKDFQKKVEEAKIALFERQTVPTLQEKVDNPTLTDLDSEDQKELNRREAEAEGLDVNSLFTNESGAANRKAVQDEQKDRMDTYVQNPGTASLEAYVDPGNYRVKGNVSERRPEEWQDDAKHNEEERLSQEEHENRMLGDFLEYRQQNDPVQYIPVDAKIYNIVKKASKDLENETGESTRYAYESEDRGEPAKVASQTEYDKNGNPVATVSAESRMSPSEAIYSADDLLDEDGGVSGLAYKAILAADPDFDSRAAGILGGKGKTGPKLAHYNENNRFLVLETIQDNDYYEGVNADRNRYQRLKKGTKFEDESGIYRGMKAIESIQKRLDYFATRIMQLTADEEKYRTALGTAKGKDAKAVAKKYQDVCEQLSKAMTSHGALQDKMDDLTARQAENEAFVRNYTAQPYRNDKTFYIIDKEGLSHIAKPTEIYNQAVINAADRITENAFLSDEGIIELLKSDHMKATGQLPENSPELIGQLIDEHYETMTHEELGAALFDHFLQEELDKLNAQAYKGIVGVIKDHNVDEATRRIKNFMDTHGGISDDGFGGDGFAQFLDRDYYKQDKARFISEEAAFKFLNAEQQKDIGLKKTAAQYNAGINTAVKAYADQNGLSEQDAAFLRKSFSTKWDNPKRIGNAVLVANDRSHFLGIPASMEGDYRKNRFIRDDSGSLSIARAKQQLEMRIKQMVEMAEAEAAHIPVNGREAKLDSDKHSIAVFTYDNEGISHKRIVGDFYQDSDGKTKRYLPSYSEIMEEAYKIVCNFPAYFDDRKDNPKMSFTLFQDSDARMDMIDTQAAMQAPDFEPANDPLNHTRGQGVLEEELERLQNLIDQLGEGEVKSKAQTAAAQTLYDIQKANFRHAWRELKSASSDTIAFWQDQVARAKVAMDEAAELISSSGDSTQKRTMMNTWLGDAIKKERENSLAENKTATPKTAKDRYLEAMTRYSDLTDPNGLYFNDSNFDVDRAVYAACLPYMKKFADDERAQQQSPVAQPAQVTPLTPEFQSEVEKLDGAAKLATLKNLENTGVDVADLRTQAVADFHAEQTKDMSSEDRMAYYAKLVDLSKTDPNAYTIDPNTNYDEVLGEVIREEDQKRKDKLGKRLKGIAAKAGTYVYPGNITRVMNELVEIEQAGYDVADVKEALSQNMLALQNPVQVQSDATSETTNNPEFQMNLGLFAAPGPAPVLETIDEAMNDVVDDLFTGMKNPRPDIVTGFEDMVSSIQKADANVTTAEQIAELEKSVAGARVSINSYNEDINKLVPRISAMKEKYDAARSEADGLLRAGVTPDNYNALQQLYQDYSDSFNNIDPDTSSDDRAKNRRAMKAQMNHILYDKANRWSDQEREDYLKAYKKYRGIGFDMTELMKDKKQMERSRDILNKESGRDKDTLLNAKLVDDVVNNRAVFGPAGLQADNRDAINSLHRNRRQKDNEVGAAVEKKLHKHVLHGSDTIYTAKEQADAWSSVLDETEIARMNTVANALGQRVKTMKENLAIIELAKKVAANNTKNFEADFDKAIEKIMELHPEREYTEQGREAHERTKAWKRKVVQDYIDSLKKRYQMDLDGEALYKVLDEQSMVIEAVIERAEHVSKNYYTISSKGIQDVFTDTHGGHMPAAMVRGYYAILRRAVKKNNPKKHYASRFDTFPNLVRSFMGKSADVFISRYVQPVREAEGKITRRQAQLMADYEHLRKLDTRTKEDITRMRNAMAYDPTIDETKIRRDFGKRADAILDGIEVAGRIFDTLNQEINVVYGRNGLELLKRRNNYVPWIDKEKNPILAAMGIHAAFDDIPTAALGKSADYVPVHEFFRFAYERKGKEMEGKEMDITKLLDVYIPSALQQIYQTDNIVRLRDMIDCINENGDYNDLGGENPGGLSHFRAFLEDYTNVIAGKKVGFIDRAIEKHEGRKFFAWAKALSQIKGQAATGMNWNVVAANLEPLTMAFGMNPVNTTRAFVDTIASRITKTDRDIVGRSNFLAVRTNDNHRTTTNYQKFIRALYTPASISDDFVSEVIWRSGLYNATKKMGISKEGYTDLHLKAIKNADNYCTSIMASKGRGEKAGVFNTSWGTITFQFLAEAVNNINFMVHHAGEFETKGSGKMATLIGSAKALAAILIALLGHEGINLITGNETVMAPYSAVKNAVDNRQEGDSVLTTALDAGRRILEGANPFDNLMDSQSKIPVVGSIPIVSSVEQSFNSLVRAAEHGYNAYCEQYKGQEFKEGETDWAYDLASAVLNWAPGGAAAKRIVDTGRAATKGYTLSQANRFKFPFEPTAGNIALSSLFGTNSSVEGRKYVKSGYRTQSDSKTAKILSDIKNGISPSVAYRAANMSADTSSSASEANKAAKFGEDNSELVTQAREARQTQGYPADMTDEAVQNMNDPAIAKGIEMWKESGNVTYPTKLITRKDEAHGKYFQYDNRYIPVSDEEAERLEKEYYDGARRILVLYDDPEVVADKMNKLKTEIKKSFIGR